jgi:hypothetical protein
MKGHCSLSCGLAGRPWSGLPIASALLPRLSSESRVLNPSNWRGDRALAMGKPRATSTAPTRTVPSRQFAYTENPFELFVLKDRHYCTFRIVLNIRKLLDFSIGSGYRCAPGAGGSP